MWNNDTAIKLLFKIFMTHQSFRLYRLTRLTGLSSLDPFMKICTPSSIYIFPTIPLITLVLLAPYLVHPTLCIFNILGSILDSSLFISLPRMFFTLQILSSLCSNVTFLSWASIWLSYVTYQLSNILNAYHSFI